MHPNIAASLDRADELLRELLDEYKAALHKKDVTLRATQLTHEVCERLRSVLDRLARLYWDRKIAPQLSEDDRKAAQIYFDPRGGSVSWGKNSLTLGQGGFVGFGPGGSISFGPGGVKFSGNVNVMGAPVDPLNQRVIPGAGVVDRLEIWVSSLRCSRPRRRLRRSPSSSWSPKTR